LIEFKDVTIERGDERLFENISFRLAPGHKAVIVGKSGSGKTSLLLAIMGIFPSVDGTIYFDGKPVEHERLQEVRQKIAFISQEPLLGADIVQDALMLPFKFKANRDAKPEGQEVEKVLGKLKLLPSILQKRSSKISAGQKQRIAIARALLLRKQTFLVDEATSALDLESKTAVANLLLEDNFTVLSVSHDDFWIERCSSVYKVVEKKLRKER